MDIADRVMGCILGGAIGDAVGAQYEGHERPEVVDWSAGALLTTDDTQLTLATCQAVCERGEVDPATIADVFRRYFLQSRLRGIGASTLKAVSELSVGGHWHCVGAKGDRAAGNGAAMRVAPLAFCLDPLTDRGRGILKDVCWITHQNDEAFAGALAIVVATRLAATSTGFNGSGLVSDVAIHLPDTLVRDRLQEFATFSVERSVHDVAAQFGCGGFVAESVPLALLGVERFLRDGFDVMIRELILCGGDTDTIASMAGAIAGVGIGGAALPKTMLAAIDEYEDIAQVAHEFAGSPAVVSHCATHKG